MSITCTLLYNVMKYRPSSIIIAYSAQTSDGLFPTTKNLKSHGNIILQIHFYVSLINDFDNYNSVF